TTLPPSTTSPHLYLSFAATPRKEGFGTGITGIRPRSRGRDACAPVPTDGFSDHRASSLANDSCSFNTPTLTRSLNLNAIICMSLPPGQKFCVGANQRAKFHDRILPPACGHTDEPTSLHASATLPLSTTSSHIRHSPRRTHTQRQRQRLRGPLLQDMPSFMIMMRTTRIRIWVLLPLLLQLQLQRFHRSLKRPGTGTGACPPRRVPDADPVSRLAPAPAPVPVLCRQRLRARGRPLCRGLPGEQPKTVHWQEGASERGPLLMSCPSMLIDITYIAVEAHRARAGRSVAVKRARPRCLGYSSPSQSVIRPDHFYLYNDLSLLIEQPHLPHDRLGYWQRAHWRPHWLISASPLRARAPSRSQPATRTCCHGTRDKSGLPRPHGLKTPAWLLV
ncbi:hypothetical protein EVG20_g9352, partial [Dentipellis fragilis]